MQVWSRAQTSVLWCAFNSLELVWRYPLSAWRLSLSPSPSSYTLHYRWTETIHCSCPTKSEIRPTSAYCRCSNRWRTWQICYGYFRHLHQCWQSCQGAAKNSTRYQWFWIWRLIYCVMNVGLSALSVQLSLERFRVKQVKSMKLLE